MTHTLTHIRAKLDHAVTLAGHALTFIESLPMTIEFLPGRVARINEITGVLYRLIQMHKTLERYEKNPAAARDLEAMFYALQNVIDNMVEDPVRRPPRQPKPPTGTTPVLFASTPTPRPAEPNAELRRIAPLPPIPKEAPTVTPNSVDATPEVNNTAATESDLEACNIFLRPASTESSMNSPAPNENKAAASTSSIMSSDGLQGRDNRGPGQAQHRPGSTRGEAAHLDPPECEPRERGAHPRPADASRFGELVSPNPSQFTKYEKFLSRIRPVAPLALGSITKILTGCQNFLTEFIHDTGVRLTIAIRVYNPALKQTLLPQIEDILFPPAPQNFSGGGPPPFCPP